MTRALYMAKTAVAGKHRRATDATNMSDERPYVREQSLTDGCATSDDSSPNSTTPPVGAMAMSFFRWLRSAAFTTSGGVDGHAATCAGRHGIGDAKAFRTAHSHRETQTRLAGIKPGPLTLFLIDLAMGLCFNIIVLVTVVEILGAPL